MFNPIVRVRVGRQKLWMPFAHPLPFLLSRHPHYDTLLPRLATALRRKIDELVIIDVGANIGDTTLLILDRAKARILAIEPDPQYFAVLFRNTREIETVTCIRTAISDADDGRIATLTKVAGTAHIATAGGVTLDTLLLSQPMFAEAHILKVDTDGFDYKVLKGAGKLLARSKPAIFFELSPVHYERVGKEDPMAVFSFLRDAGYATMAFYDNEGWLIFHGTLPDEKLLAALLGYARIKGHYYDVLALHGNAEAFAREFFSAEIRYFHSVA